MSMKMPFGMRLINSRTLMKSHGVWKWRFEKIVVAYAHAMHDVGQRIELS